MSVRIKAVHSLVGSLLLGAALAPAYAQYQGPSDIGKASVAEILKNPNDDQDVQLRGHLLRQTAHDKYVFSDGTGEIVAEIDDKHFAGQAIDDKVEVEVIGEVDTSRKRPPEIEVDVLRVVK